MKKTLSILAFASLATAQGATIYTTSTVSSATGNGNYRGFAIPLIASGITESNEALPETVLLNSINLSPRTSGAAGMEFKIAVYEFTADGIVGEFMGLSTNSATSSTGGADMTLTFDHILLNSSSTYQYLFVTADTTVEDLHHTAGDANLAAYRERSTAVGITVVNNSLLPAGSGTYTTNSLNSWEGYYIPQFTMTTSSVPEPATVSLSLLGLSALLLRRRV